MPSSPSSAPGRSTADGGYAMKMKAAVLYGANEPLRVEDVTLDDPQDHEVMVRLVATGICHSDLLLMKGEVPTQYPVVAGHEGAGVVEKVGHGVVSVKPGDHVVLPAIFSCGQCRPCIQGQPTLCLETLPAHLMGGLPGGGKRLHNDKGDINVFYSQGSFAEHVIVHESSAIKVRSGCPAGGGLPLQLPDHHRRRGRFQEGRRPARRERCHIRLRGGGAGGGHGGPPVRGGADHRR